MLCLCDPNTQFIQFRRVYFAGRRRFVLIFPTLTRYYFEFIIFIVTSNLHGNQILPQFCLMINLNVVRFNSPCVQHTTYL